MLTVMKFDTTKFI